MCILSVVVGLCPLLRHAVEHIGLMHKHEKCVFHSEFWWIVMIRPNDDRFSICICKAVSGTDHKKNVQNVAGNSPGRRSAIRMRKILQTESFGKHSSWHKMLRIGDENVYSTMPSIHKPRLAEHGLHRNTSVPVKCALGAQYTHTGKTMCHLPTEVSRINMIYIVHTENIKCYKFSDR